MKRRAETPIAALRNLGPKSALMLREAGLTTIEELRELGALKAYLRVKAARSKGVSLNLLWAMAAGLEDRDWRDLSAQEKTDHMQALKQISVRGRPLPSRSGA